MTETQNDFEASGDTLNKPHDGNNTAWLHYMWWRCYRRWKLSFLVVFFILSPGVLLIPRLDVLWRCSANSTSIVARNLMRDSDDCRQSSIERTSNSMTERLRMKERNSSTKVSRRHSKNQEVLWRWSLPPLVLLLQCSSKGVTETCNDVTFTTSRGCRYVYIKSFTMLFLRH